MATTGPNYPSVGANDNDTGEEDYAPWQNPSYITDGTTSSAQCSVYSSGIYTSYLKGTGYGFSIASDQIIDGIELVIRRYTIESFVDAKIQLMKAGSFVGSNLSTGAHWATTTGNVTFGGATELWGTTWTYSDINNANFGSVIQAYTPGFMEDLDLAVVYYATITIYHHTSGGGGAGGNTYNEVASGGTKCTGKAVKNNRTQIGPYYPAQVYSSHGWPALGGSVDWSNINNVKVADGTNASVSLSGNSLSYPIYAIDFQSASGTAIDLQPGEYVTGIKVEIGKARTSGTAFDWYVGLMHNGNVAGVNKAVWVSPSTTQSYGGVSDTFEIILSNTALNNPNGFGVFYQTTQTSGSSTVTVDYIRVTLYLDVMENNLTISGSATDQLVRVAKGSGGARLSGSTSVTSSQSQSISIAGPKANGLATVVSRQSIVVTANGVRASGSAVSYTHKFGDIDAAGAMADGFALTSSQYSPTISGGGRLSGAAILTGSTTVAMAGGARIAGGHAANMILTETMIGGGRVSGVLQYVWNETMSGGVQIDGTSPNDASSHYIASGGLIVAGTPWLYQRPIVVPHGNVTTTLEKFLLPVAVQLDPLKAVAAVFEFRDTEGNRLASEIRQYDSETGRLWAYVKTKVSSTLDTTITLFYGR